MQIQDLLQENKAVPPSSVIWCQKIKVQNKVQSLSTRTLMLLVNHPRSLRSETHSVKSVSTAIQEM